MKNETPKAKPGKKRKTLIKSVSLTKRIIDLGESRAKAAQRSFSNHVSVLIERDYAAAK